MTQQARELSNSLAEDGHAPRFLIRDRDAKFVAASTPCSPPMAPTSSGPLARTSGPVNPPHPIDLAWPRTCGVTGGRIDCDPTKGKRADHLAEVKIVIYAIHGDAG